MCGVCGVHLAFPSFRTLTRLLWAVSYSVSNYMLKIINQIIQMLDCVFSGIFIFVWKIFIFIFNYFIVLSRKPSKFTNYIERIFFIWLFVFIIMTGNLFSFTFESKGTILFNDEVEIVNTIDNNYTCIFILIRVKVFDFVQDLNEFKLYIFRNCRDIIDFNNDDSCNNNDNTSNQTAYNDNKKRTHNFTLYFFIGVAQFIFIALFAGLFGKEKDSP